MKIKFYLTPIDRFFFGGEKSPVRQEYSRRSNTRPQQSGVLGFLRYEILKRNELLDSDRSNWANAIGGESFNGETGQDFGIIEKVSPIFLSNQTNDFFPFRNLNGIQFKNEEVVKANYGHSTQAVDKSVTLSGYDAKDYEQLSLCYASLNGDGNVGEVYSNEMDGTKQWHQTELARPIPKSDSGCFWQEMRPGIRKNYNGQAVDMAYFKTQYWHLRKDLSFAFYADLKIEKSDFDAKWSKPALVTFGGENSAFHCVCEKAKTALPDLNHGNIYSLISDCYVDESIYDLCDIEITDTVPFRNLKTNNQQTRFHKRPTRHWNEKEGKKEENTHSKKVMLKHGSILLAKEGKAAQLSEKLNNVAFQKIGYNHYLRFNQLPQIKLT